MQSEQSDLRTSFKYLPEVKILMKFVSNVSWKEIQFYNLLNLSYSDLDHSFIDINIYVRHFSKVQASLENLFGFWAVAIWKTANRP